MFSVIIPLYNKATYIEKAIYSVLNQSFQEFEIIVVDDGSIDNGLNVVKEINKSINFQIKIINQQNQGVSIARNNGVKAANYSYIAFLDADDWWSPNYLAEMSNVIELYKDAALWAASYYKVKRGINKPANIGVEEEFKVGYINYCDIYAKTLWMPIWTGAVVLRKSVFEEMNGFKPGLKLGEDFDLWIRVALKYKVVFLNTPLAFYNQDVEIKNRGVSGILYKKEEHFLFNLDYLIEKERVDKSLKNLLDKMRIYSLFPYYLDKNRNKEVQIELLKVDWAKQPIGVRIKYKLPILFLKLHFHLIRQGSLIKKYINKWV